MDNPETHTTYTRHRTKIISKRQRKPKRKPIMDNPETHTTLDTQDTGQRQQVNVRDNRRGNL